MHGRDPNANTACANPHTPGRRPHPHPLRLHRRLPPRRLRLHRHQLRQRLPQHRPASAHADPDSGPAQAINLSTRMQVQPGDNAGIGGFIINGSGLKHVLIRAIGPSLAQFGVPNVLADPVLELHGPGYVVTITNDNWRQTQEAEIQATGIAPANNLEAAIDATLPAGAYTAIVRGNGNGTGVSLIEVYDLETVAFVEAGQYQHARLHQARATTS